MPLSRFLQAQADPDTGYAAALGEIRTTGKRGHWVWYIFPQLAGLGRSADARYFALADVDEAAAYLAHPVLGARLVEIGAAVAERVRGETGGGGIALIDLMNSEIDTLKFVSCMTLFMSIAERVHEANRTDVHRAMFRVTTKILAAAKTQGFPPCAFTLSRLHADANALGRLTDTP